MVALIYPLLRFTESPDRDAAVRLDFHQSGCWTNSEEWSITPGAFLGAPGTVGAEYDYTHIQFRWYVTASTRADARRAQSALARELLRERTYLQLQLSPTDQPMWYRCHRSSVGEMSMRYVQPLRSHEDVWFIDVSLVADPFALGEQKSFEVTVANDPEAENGLCVVLPEIEGDAPAPLVVEYEVPADDPSAPLVTTIAIDEEWPGLQFWQAESWTLNEADIVTAAGSSDGEHVEMDFVSEPSLVTRLTGAVAPAFAGTYRVFARVEVDGFTELVGGGTALLSSVTTRTIGSDPAVSGLVEIGTYAFPKGNPPARPGYTLSPAAGAVKVRAEGDSGTPDMAVDFIVAVPVTLFEEVAPSASFEFIEHTLTDDRVYVLDGEADQVIALDPTDGGLPEVESIPAIRGEFPHVIPGATNVLHYLSRRLRPVGSGSGMAESETLTISYRPQWQWLVGS